MQTTERWRTLLKQTSTELDPKKLDKLFKELARLLKVKTPTVYKNK